MKIVNIGIKGLLLILLITATMQTEAQQKETLVLIKTTLGDIKIKLYNETPVHRDNFIKLVTEKYYDGVIFHRVIKDFMIQGGDPNSRDSATTQPLGTGGPGYTLPAEIVAKYFHKKGVLSAARTGDQMNPQRRSSGSQFYIVQGVKYTAEQLKTFEQRLFTTFTPEQIAAYTTIGGTPHLDAQYTVFGEVVEGLEVVDRISAAPIGANDRPKQNIVIIGMEIIKK